MKHLLCAAFVAAAGATHAAPVVFDNGMPDGLGGYFVFAAIGDDFSVGAPTAITGVGFYAASFSGNPDSPFKIQYEIYPDNGGLPDMIDGEGLFLPPPFVGVADIASVNDVGAPACCGQTSFLVEFDLTTSFNAAANTPYWLVLRPETAGDFWANSIFWSTSDATAGNATTLGASVIAAEMAFFLRGEPTVQPPTAPIPLPAPVALLASGLVALVGVGRFRRKV
jgi:hypothetical protein